MNIEAMSHWLEIPEKRRNFDQAKAEFMHRFLTTGQAAQAMQLIFDYLRLNMRQFGHLVAARLRVLAQKQRPTSPTCCRSTEHETTNLFGWFQAPSLALVARLTPALTLPLFDRWLAFQQRWVARWWLGRILRALIHLLAQSRDFLLQLFDSHQQGQHQLANRFRGCLPIFDRYAVGWLLLIHAFSMLDFMASGYDSFFQFTTSRTQLNGYLK